MQWRRRAVTNALSSSRRNSFRARVRVTITEGMHRARHTHARTESAWNRTRENLPSPSFDRFVIKTHYGTYYNGFQLSMDVRRGPPGLVDESDAEAVGSRPTRTLRLPALHLMISTQ